MNPSELQIWELRHAAEPQPLSLAAATLDEASRLLPQGFYSTFRTFGHGTRALDLEHHLARLYGPAAAQGLSPAVDEPGLRRALAGLLQACRPAQPSFDEARVRISLAAQGRPGAMYIAIEPLKRLPDEVYRSGVAVVSTPAERSDPRLKSTAFIGQSAQARRAVAQAGAFEGLLVHHGRIREGLTSNFYAIRGNELHTARQGILLGVTRRLLLRLARAERLGVVYRALPLAELGRLDEAFITSSSRSVVPVVSVDGLPVGTGQVGAITRRLMRRYDDYVERHAALI